MSHGEELLTRIEKRGPVTVREFVSLVEANHAAERPGVAQETLERYADEANATIRTADGEVSLDAETLRDAIDEHLVTTRMWADADAVYRVDDGRVSTYPASWHDALGGTDDPERTLAYLYEEASAFVAETSGEGVPREMLLGILVTLGDAERDDAESNLRAALNDGDVLQTDDSLTLPADRADGTDAGGEGLPPVLDIRGALDEIEAESEADVDDEIEEIRDLLDEIESRDPAIADRESLVDDIDGLVSSMRERLSGDADRRAEAIGNRLGTYRNDETEATLSFADAALFGADGERVELDGASSGPVALSGTAVNGGDMRQAVVAVRFEDDTGQRLREIRFGPYDLDAGERRTIEESVYLPPGAAAFETEVVAAAERPIGGK